jgi:hypothetical protein
MVGHVSERVDGGSPHVGVGMMEELEGARHEELFSRTALALLASVTRQRMQREAQHADVFIIEGGDQVGQRVFVNQLVEDSGAHPPHHRLGMMKTGADGGHSSRTGRQQVPSGSLPATRDRQLLHPSVEVTAGRGRTHCADGTPYGQYLLLICTT